MTPALLTPRLLLRPLEHEDGLALADLLNRPEVARGLCTIPKPFTPLHASAMILMIRAAEARGLEFVWAVENSDGDVVGQIGLRQVRPGSAQLGYAFLPEFWGQGLGSEAMEAVLDWATRQTSFTTIEAEAHSDNPASLHMLEKLGFVQRGSVQRFSLAHQGRIPLMAFQKSLTAAVQLAVA
jgi:ribosomal-protein-alanine N-acetyltransferase